MFCSIFKSAPCRHHQVPDSLEQSARVCQQEARKHHEEHYNSLQKATAALADCHGSSMQPALSNEHLEAPLDGKQLRFQADAAFGLLSEAAKVNKTQLSSGTTFTAQQI